jgi:hypothetical protein
MRRELMPLPITLARQALHAADLAEVMEEQGSWAICAPTG